jgi:hypothetical protein
MTLPYARGGTARRILLAWVTSCAIACLGAVAGPAAGDSDKPLVLEKSGAQRRLPGRMLGGSAEALIEHLLDNPRKVAALKEMSPAFVRFPGGSQSNYYNWRTGLLEFHITPQSSAYMRFWGDVAPKINDAFPGGVSIQDYTKFSKEVGAEVVLVPNLETSSVAEQVEWFCRMKADGIVPRWIELGNEFWIAMGFDPDVTKRWPDEPTSMQIMKEYAEALRPFLPPGARVAVQGAASEFWFRPGPVRGAWGRLRQWDEDLAPAPWFDAVTLHLYPRIGQIMGSPDAIRGWRRADEASRLFKALMAHCDQGAERAIEDARRRLPGKEIWITEWNTRGADYRETDEPLDAMHVHLVARMTFVFLRRQEVTMSLFFTLNFTRSSVTCSFRPDGKGGYQPRPQIIALRWFNEAASGGPTYQRLVEAGASRVPGGGAIDEGYLEVEAGLFRAAGRTTLIVQNCSPVARTLRLPESVPENAPSSIEILGAPDLCATEPIAPAIQPPEAGGKVRIPPYSITRVIWK